MDRSGQLVGEQRIDPALARDAALAGEGGGDDLDVKVGFPLRTGTGMAGMPVRLVADVEPHRLQCRGRACPGCVGRRA